MSSSQRLEFAAGHSVSDSESLTRCAPPGDGREVILSLEFMAHGKGTDVPSSSLFAKRHQVNERHSGVLKSFPLRGGRLHNPTAPVGLEAHVTICTSEQTQSGLVE